MIYFTVLILQIFLQRTFQIIIPHPDIFICQGDKYYQKLIKIFDKKKFIKLEVLKVELDDSLKIKNEVLEKN